MTLKEENCMNDCVRRARLNLHGTIDPHFIDARLPDGLPNSGPVGACDARSFGIVLGSFT